MGGVLFIGAAFFIGMKMLPKQSLQETADISHPLSGEQVIRMTEDGFVPDVIIITKGTKIRFLNADTLAHWPASDLHPSHTLYPEFDPHMPIESGKEWDFTFEKIGKWNMHDHLAPYITGTVQVVE